MKYDEKSSTMSWTCCSGLLFVLLFWVLLWFCSLFIISYLSSVVVRVLHVEYYVWCVCCCWFLLEIWRHHNYLTPFLFSKKLSSSSYLIMHYLLLITHKTHYSHQRSTTTKRKIDYHLKFSNHIQTNQKQQRVLTFRWCYTKTL